MKKYLSCPQHYTAFIVYFLHEWKPITLETGTFLQHNESANYTSELK